MNDKTNNTVRKVTPESHYKEDGSIGDAETPTGWSPAIQPQVGIKDLHSLSCEIAQKFYMG